MISSRAYRSSLFPRRRVGRPVGASVLLALLLLAVACGPAATDDPRFGGRVVRRDPVAAVTAAPPTTVATLTPPPYAVTWTPGNCPFSPASANGFTIDCGMLTVPMKRSVLSGKTVKIAAARIHSSSPTPLPDPVVYLEGGPGGSAISSVDFWTKPAASILEDRDLILVDQRGTGYSEPRLFCEQFDQDIELFADVGSLAADCLHQLQNTGVDVTGFNTTESAADIADLRWALKFDKWNLFGISYGTRLALWIMKTRPEGVRAVVIDSVYPPGVQSYTSIPTSLNRSLQAVFADCAAQPTCAAAYPDLNALLARAIDVANDKYFQGGSDFVDMLHSALYQTDVIPDVPKALRAAAAGDLFTAQDLFFGSGAKARHPDEAERPESIRERPHMSEALFHAVECAEAAPGNTSASIREGAAALPPQLRTEIVNQDLQSLALCNVWKMPPNPLSVVESAIPTLVLAGTYDPITPPAWGELAAKTLSSSKFVLVNGAGHGVWTAGDCPKQLIKLYFDDPAAPGPDCTSAPPEFSR